ncbi:MAG: hypothetical protein ABJE95_28920 [Byssovorax sp.]
MRTWLLTEVMVVMKQHIKSLLFAAGAAFLATGCYASAGTSTVAYVETSEAPVEIDVETYPHTYYEGRTVYFYQDRWYYQDAGRWSYYRDEPPVLYRQRGFVQQAPPADHEEHARRERADQDEHARREHEQQERGQREQQERGQRDQQERAQHDQQERAQHDQQERAQHEQQERGQREEQERRDHARPAPPHQQAPAVQLRRGPGPRRVKGR